MSFHDLPLKININRKRNKTEPNTSCWWGQASLEKRVRGNRRQVNWDGIKCSLPHYWGLKTGMPHGVSRGLGLQRATSSSSPGSCFPANQPFLFSLYMHNSLFCFYTLPSHPLPHACVNYWVPLSEQNSVRQEPARIQQYRQLRYLKCINFI